MESRQRPGYGKCGCVCRVTLRRCLVLIVGLGGVWKPLDGDAANHGSGHRLEHPGLLSTAVLRTV